MKKKIILFSLIVLNMVAANTIIANTTSPIDEVLNFFKNQYLPISGESISDMPEAVL